MELLKRKHYFIHFFRLKIEVRRDSLLCIELKQFKKLALTHVSSVFS